MRHSLLSIALFAGLTGPAAAQGTQGTQSFDRVERGRYLAVLSDCGADDRARPQFDVVPLGGEPGPVQPQPGCRRSQSPVLLPVISLPSTTIPRSESGARMASGSLIHMRMRWQAPGSAKGGKRRGA